MQAETSLALNLKSSYLSLPSAEIIDIHHHIWLPSFWSNWTLIISLAALSPKHSHT
jgi:hypothetical protein